MQSIVGNMIPKKIHFVFLSKHEPMPQTFTYLVSIAQKMHPNWEICFYNEDDARVIIEHQFPELTRLYYSYPMNVQRADMLRVLIVYLYGGFYLDMDMYCLKKLDPLLKYDIVLAEEKMISTAERDDLKLKNRQRIANYMFGSKPKHPFWLGFIDLLISRSSNKIINENDVLESTGPGILTDFYHANTNNYRDIILLNNNDRKCLNEGHSIIGCHFGNYAAHLHAGTWRGQLSNSKICVPSNNTAYDVIQSVSVAKYNLDTICGPFFDLKGKPNHDMAMKHVYTILRPFGQPSKKRETNISIFFDLKSDQSYKAHTADTNVYMSRCKKSLISADSTTINKYFKHCITFSASLKCDYMAAGIRIPIHIISPAFKRLRREFDDKFEPVNFTIGCFAWSHTYASILELISSVIVLAQAKVKNIKLKIYDPNRKFLSLIDNTYKYIEFCHIPLSDKRLSYWFNDIAVMVFGAAELECSLEAMKVIYLGIPVIIPQTNNYDLIRKKIKSKALITLNISDYQTLPNLIAEIYDRYEYFNKKASAAAMRIEDIWTPEELKYDFLQLLPQL